MPEFVGRFPVGVPEQRAYRVVLEGLTSRHDSWRTLLEFDLQLKNLVHPSNYIVYTNDPEYLSGQELAEGAERLAKLKQQYGLV